MRTHSPAEKRVMERDLNNVFKELINFLKPTQTRKSLDYIDVYELVDLISKKGDIYFRPINIEWNRNIAFSPIVFSSINMYIENDLTIHFGERYSLNAYLNDPETFGRFYNEDAYIDKVNINDRLRDTSGYIEEILRKLYIKINDCPKELQDELKKRRYKRCDIADIIAQYQDVPTDKLNDDVIKQIIWSGKQINKDVYMVAGPEFSKFVYGSTGGTLEPIKSNVDKDVYLFTRIEPGVYKELLTDIIVKDSTDYKNGNKSGLSKGLYMDASKISSKRVRYLYDLITLLQETYGDKTAKIAEVMDNAYIKSHFTTYDEIQIEDETIIEQTNNTPEPEIKEEETKSINGESIIDILRILNIEDDDLKKLVVDLQKLPKEAQMQYGEEIIYLNEYYINHRKTLIYRNRERDITSLVYFDAIDRLKEKIDNYYGNNLYRI